MKLSELFVGQSASLKKRFTSEELVQFSEISLDKNPIHLDEEYASKSPFGKRIVYGYLTASLFSGLIGSKLPGNGSIYLGQSLNFKKPVYLGEEVTATVTITKIRDDKPIITLETICVNNKGEVLIDGNAVVKLIE
ncbi:MAG: MaoC family dehydratase [Bacteroidales bacterium]|nr:MaoC family dehydratase [Bacteroidales bacterium]